MRPDASTKWGLFEHLFVFQVPDRLSAPFRNLTARGGAVGDAWDEYDAWNSAVVDVIFLGCVPSTPVYLDIDDQVLEQVANSLNLANESSDLERRLFQAVRAVLNVDDRRDHGAVFAPIRQRAKRWLAARSRRGTDPSMAPPVIAVLTSFARAAEHMVRDEKYSSNAYLPRLLDLLDLTSEDRQRAEASFRHESEFFWGLLNQWLDDNGGSFGLPTAESIGPRYVGIPLSQALLRDSDRVMINRFFEDAGFDVGLVLSADDMEDYLGDWFASGKGSNSLKKIWGNKSARRVLVDSASQLLAGWNGPAPTDDSLGGREAGYGGHGRLMICARIARPLLGSERVDLGFVARRGATSSQASSFWLVESSQDSDPPEIELTPITDSLIGPNSLDELAGESLLTGNLRLRSLDTSIELERTSQPICVLARSDEAGMFVEVQRAQREAQHLVLANTRARKPNGDPVFDLDSLLEQVARPGFRKETGMLGLPDGWALYRDVVIERTHTSEEKVLECLRPAASSAVTVQGGLRLPGRQVRWHIDSSLEIRGSSEGAHQIRLSVLRLEAGAETEIRSWDFDSSEASSFINPGEVPIGRYRIEMTARGSNRQPTRNSSAVLICGSDEPRPLPMDGVISYHSTHGGVPPELGGTLTDHALEGVRGVICTLDRPREFKGLSPDALTEPWWSFRQPAATVRQLTQVSGADSCVFTGAHRWHIETATPGRSRSRGECQRCGRVQMFRNRLPARRTVSSRQVSSAPLKPVPLKPIQPEVAVPLSAMLDALIWMQGGSISDFAHVVRQMDNSALSVHEALVTLESLGHIDVARDPYSFDALHWQVAPRALAETVEGRWVLVGRWNAEARRALAETLKDMDGRLDHFEERWFVTPVTTPMTRASLELVADEVGEKLGETAPPLVEQAGLALIDALRPLSVALNDLPRYHPGYLANAECFIPSETRWQRVQGADQEGAYRTSSGFVTRYLLRTPNDVDASTAVRVSATVAKHGGAYKRPLVGYDHQNSLLLVPLGAELPGLYGRAMTLMSGRPPQKINGANPYLAYGSISPDAAAKMLSLLT